MPTSPATECRAGEDAPAPGPDASASPRLDPRSAFRTCCKTLAQVAPQCRIHRRTCFPPIPLTTSQTAPTNFQQMIRRKLANVPLITASCPDQSEVYSSHRHYNAKTKRPPGNWAASSSRENSSNGRQSPSKLSGEIL